MKILACNSNKELALAITNYIGVKLANASIRKFADGEAFVKSVPRGDDDIPVQSFLKGLDPSQYRGEFFSDLPDDYVDPGLTPGHPLNPNEGYHRVDNFRN